MDNVECQRLVSLIKETAVPLMPQPPSLPPDLEALRGLPAHAGKLRAVLFDVYGTLFCSSAGDTGFADNREKVGQGDFLLEDLTAKYGMFGVDMRSWFREKVAEIHNAAGAEYPEVQVDTIWGDRELALRYELAVNPVYPMPGAAETIEALRKAGSVLGIISNAQFFTPLLFNAFFGASPEELGFDTDLLIWSYKMGEAKPSPRLFATAAHSLAAKGIAADETIFVGNDMLSDIYGASCAGFRTVLFAGDGRSLRLREGDSRVQGLRPFAVAGSLEETLKIYVP